MRVAVARRAHAELSDRAVARAVAVVCARVHAHGEVSVAFVGERRMRELNRTYHGEDRVTDVLAFAGGEARTSRRATKRRMVSSERSLGELIICPPDARRNAARAGELVRRELARLIIHGTLHLCGYDHVRARDAERMFTLQEQLVRSLDHA